MQKLNDKVVVHIFTFGVQSYKSLIQTGRLILYREIVDVCSQIHTKHKVIQCVHNLVLFHFKLVVHIMTIGRQKVSYRFYRTDS
jgi:hypothetical protein